MVRPGPVTVTWTSHTSRLAVQIAETQPCWPGCIGATAGRTRSSPSVWPAWAGAAGVTARVDAIRAARSLRYLTWFSLVCPNRPGSGIVPPAPYQLGVERVEPVLPERPVPGQPRVQRRQRCGIEGVDAA